MISSAWFFALEGRWSLKDEWNHFQGQSRNFQYWQLLLTSQGLQPHRRSSPWPSPPWGCCSFFAPEIDIMPCRCCFCLRECRTCQTSGSRSPQSACRRTACRCPWKFHISKTIKWGGVLANGQSPKDRDVVEDDGDHLEDFTGLNSRGSVLDEEKFFLSKNSRLPPWSSRRRTWASSDWEGRRSSSSLRQALPCSPVQEQCF